MEVTLQSLDDCPGWKTTASYLFTLVGEGWDVVIGYEPIDTHRLAVARDFHGSPTVLIDGADPFADEKATIGLACRTYPTEDGPARSPSMSQLRQAVAIAIKE